MGPGKHPNSLKNLKPYKPGAEWTGGGGSKRVGASLREWWNSLAHEDADGNPRYTQEQIRAFADAPDDDKKVSPMKRAAARHLIEMGTGGRTGREVSAMMFDRVEGRPSQHISVDSGPEVKRIVLMDQQALPERLADG